MKTYIVVEKVHGYRNLLIEAESEKEALEKVNAQMEAEDFGELESIEWEHYDIEEDKTL